MTVQAEPEALDLFGRSTVEGYTLPLDDGDRRWLWTKRTLRLGTSAPDYPPFDITANADDYQGITADFTNLIGELLHLRVEVLRYSSRQEAIAALHRGEIDLLGSANTYDTRDADLVLSEAYADDLPTLVTRIGEELSSNDGLAGKRLAMVYHYLPVDTVQRFYPDAQLQSYPSTLSALGAVAFGQADVFLGNLLGANYLVNGSYLNNVQLASFAAMEAGHFGFAMRRDERVLLRLVNAALDRIEEDDRSTIMRRWGSGSISMPGQQHLQFSQAEQQWLDAHPRVRVLINEGFAPFTYLDDTGQFRGIAADVLEKISLRTGLLFDVRISDSLADAAERVARGDADMLAALTPSKMREAEFSFSRAYFTNAFVLVSRDSQEAPSTLDDMAGKRLALIEGNVLEGYITLNYPQVVLVMAKNALDATVMVDRGDVDAAVNSLISARYIISHQYRGRLRISSTVGNNPGYMAFAMSPAAKELQSILDKALLSIGPEEMEALTNRWRREAVVGDSYWETYRPMIVQGFLVATALLTAAFLWIFLLRRQIRRREQAERALTDQMEFMRVLIDGTPNPIYVRDREARLSICNAAYLDVFGVSRDAVIGKRVTEGVLGKLEEAYAYEEQYFQVMESGEPLIQDSQLTLTSGEVLTIFHWMLPYRRGDGQMVGIIAGWIDVSERLRLLQAADDASKAKSHFLATMSHEIRTPLNAVIGMLELAMKKAEQGVFDFLAIEVASGASRHLLELIGDILDIARIESGHMNLTPERANLHTLIESVVRVFESLARDKCIELLVELDGRTNCEVLIDPLRFKQVLSNLLSNAIKFTEKGSVLVTLTIADTDEPDQLLMQLRVKDSGVGIPEDDLQALFAPFTQASNNRQHARSGSGLGLVISRTLCDMMGGSLTLNSILGVGSEVTLTLMLTRLALLPQELAASTQPVNTHVLRILVVDDYPANRMVLSQQLGYLGHQVVEAEEGKQGLKLWRMQHFDVVITDCHMPVMNGYEMASLIRAEELQHGSQPCLLLGFTANAMADERARCQAAGMDDCLFKPTSLMELARWLGSVQPSARKEQRDEQGSLNLSSLEELSGGNDEVIKNLLTDLIRSTREDLLHLDHLIAEPDGPALVEFAHRIKGGARIVKAQHLVKRCEMFELADNLELSSAELRARGLQLREAMNQLVTNLDAYCNK